MRAPTITAVLLSMIVTPVAVDAQRVGGAVPGATWSQPRTGTLNAPRPGQPGNWNGPRPVQQQRMRQPRWGGNVDGRWYAGMHAPGGWNAYRRPARGWTLPRYWVAPGFFINDYETYGLATPPAGYNWSRYYDDAVLVDRRGQVWDAVDGVEWDRYDDGYHGGGAYADDGYYGDRSQYRERHDYGVEFAPPREVVQSNGYSTTSYSTGYRQDGYVSGGYWYPPATQTVVTVASAPVTTTTTTTEYVETRHVAPRRVWKAKKVAWKPRPKVRSCTCVCTMVCR